MVEEATYRSIPSKEYDRLMKLDAAVRRVLEQEGDDLCWRDIYTELAHLVGIHFCPQLICSREKFLQNCAAFDKSLREGGEYIPVHVRDCRDRSLEELLAECRKWELTPEERKIIDDGGSPHET